MSISAGDIQKLRETSGAGVMECKKVLEEAQGDFDKALKLIRERGLARGQKRADREAGAGFVHAYVHGGRIGVLIDLRAETDFVVRSEPFKKLAQEIALQVAASSPKDIQELLDQPYIRDESRKISDLVGEVISQVGENVKVNQFSRIEI